MPQPARGSTVVVQQDKPEGREVPEGRLSGSFEDGSEYDSYGEGDSEETVTEIVGEEIVELESEEDVEQNMDQDHQNDQKRIEEQLKYLEVDKDQYINQDYKNQAQESPHRRLNEYDQMVSPIEEDQREHDETIGTQYKSSPLQKSYNSRLYPRQHNPYGSRKSSKKTHLIWEKERRARKKAAKKAAKSIYPYAPYELFTGQKPNWAAQVPKSKRGELKEKVRNPSELWKLSNQSKVPMLSDHMSSVTTSGSNNPLVMRGQKEKGKANHHINNLFHESILQKRLSGKVVDKVSAPPSHISFSKEVGRAWMTPLDQNV